MRTVELIQPLTRKRKTTVFFLKAIRANSRTTECSPKGSPTRAPGTLHVTGPHFPDTVTPPPSDPAVEKVARASESARKDEQFSLFYCESRLKSLARDQAVSPRPSHSAGCTWPRTLCSPPYVLVYVPLRTVAALSCPPSSHTDPTLPGHPPPRPGLMYDPCTHTAGH